MSSAWLNLSLSQHLHLSLTSLLSRLGQCKDHYPTTQGQPRYKKQSCALLHPKQAHCEISKRVLLHLIITQEYSFPANELMASPVALSKTFLTSWLQTALISITQCGGFYMSFKGMFFALSWLYFLPSPPPRTFAQPLLKNPHVLSSSPHPCSDRRPRKLPGSLAICLLHTHCWRALPGSSAHPSSP